MNSKAAQHIITVLIICVSVLSLSVSADTNNTNYPQTKHDNKHNLNIDILAIDDDIKALLDREIRPIRDPVDRAVQLHDLMFNSHRLNIKYSLQDTLTANQTFYAGKGNCLSLAVLYVAAARHVGLRAKFRRVNILSDWEDKPSFTLLPRHVNVSVPIGLDTVQIEFLGTFFNQEFLTKNTKLVSDNRIFAEYHNNIGMEYLESGNYENAVAHVERALEYDEKTDFLWSNYGVIKKLMGELDAAEAMYKKALSINKRNLSTMTNLQALLHHTGRQKEAMALGKKIEKQHRKNPYYLARIARAKFESGNYELALEHISKAIRHNKKEARFHHLQARIYVSLNMKDKALRALKRASKTSEDFQQEEIYNSKISQLLAQL